MRRAVLFIFAGLAVLVGCEAITGFDRSRILAAGPDSADAMTSGDGSDIDGVAAGPDAGATDSGVVAVVVRDPLNRPVVDASITFHENGVETRVSTDSQGSAARAMVDGGAVSIALGPYVTGVANGDVIRIGPDTRLGGSVQGTVMLPSDLDAGVVTGAFGDCAGDVALPLDASAGPYPYAAIVAPYIDARDVTHRCAGGAAIGATFVARDPSGMPVSAAFKSAVVASTDAGTHTDVASSDFQHVSISSMAFSGPAPMAFDSKPFANGEARTDFPFGEGPWPGERRAQAPTAPTPFDYFVPPAVIMPVVIVTTSLSTALPFKMGMPCNGVATSMHVRRRAAAAALMEDFSGFLPAIDANGTFVAPLGTDTIVSDTGCVYALKSGSTALALRCGLRDNAAGSVVLIASPELPYSLARQYPTLLSDPFALLARALPMGDVDLWYSFLMFQCPA